MRVLFCFAGGTGHFLPLLALARATRAAGHEVAFGAQPALMGSVLRAGFPALDTQGITFRDDSVRLPLLPADMEREYQVVRDGYAGRIARSRAVAIISQYREYRPDLLVCDEMDFGAMVAAERLAIPHATMLVTAIGSLARPDLIAGPLNALRAEHGLPADPDLAMLARYLVLSPFPPRLRDPAFPLPATARSFRPAMPDTTAALPAWFDRLPHPRTVYVTLGTVFNVESGDLFRRLLEGLGGLEMNVIATVGPQIDPGELGPQPANVRVEQYLDQWSVLPHCDCVVSHGGSGTVMGALAHGLPMVLLPMGADQPLNARRCEALGLARVLDPMRVTPGLLREAVAALSAEPRYRREAARMGREIAALPEQGQAVALLEALAAYSGHTPHLP